MSGEARDRQLTAVDSWRRRVEDWTSWLPILLLAAGVALTSTAGVGVGGSWFDEQRILLSFALSLVGVLASVLWPAPGDRASIAVSAALALGLLSAWLAARPFVAAVEWSIHCLIAILVLTARAPRSSMVLSMAAFVAALVPAAYVTGVLANYVSALLLDFPVGAETLLVGFSNPRFPAQLQVLTIPLLPLAYHRAPTNFWRACLVGVASLWWMCFIGSGSRTAWIAIAAAGTVVAFLGSEGRRWLRWQLVFGALGLFLWGLLFHVLPALLSIDTAPETGRFSDFASFGHRLQLWRISIESALAHPMLGIGPMHFAYFDNGLGAHPHNFWLQLAAEWGIPATLLIASTAVALVVGIWRAVKQGVDRTDRAVGVALLAAVSAWSVGTLSDGYMVVPTSQAMSTAVLMLAVMWLRSVAPASRTQPEPRVSAYARLGSSSMAAFGVIALAVLATLPFTDFGQPTRREQSWRAVHAGETLLPRFWQQGWIGSDNDPTARGERQR